MASDVWLEEATLRYVLGYRADQLKVPDLEAEIAAFWDEYDHNPQLQAQLNSAVEGLASLDPTVRRALIRPRAPSGFDLQQFVDIVLQGLLAKAAVEVLWRSVFRRIVERRGLDALGEREKSRDKEED